MQNQILITKEETDFKISANLNIDNSTFLTRELFKLVSENKITFEIKSKPGSIYSEIIVGIVSGIFSNILYDLCKKIHNELKENIDKKQKVDIFTKTAHYEISGEETDKLPERK